VEDGALEDAADADGLQVQVAELLDGEDGLFSWPGWTMLATMLTRQMARR